MAITPNGDPAWLRTADHTTYGGNLNKQNYQSQGTVNARTDIDSAEFVRMVEDLAAAVRTAPFCTLTYTADDTGTNDPTVTFVNMMTGVRVLSYAGGSPPAGFPAVTRPVAGDGIANIDFDATSDDDYGVTGTIHIVHAMAQLNGTAFGSANPTISDFDANTFNERVQVRVADDTGVLTDQNVTVTVWTGPV